MSVLEERRGVALEAQGLLPTERDRLLRLDADDVVPDRRHADRLGDLPFLHLREILAALGDLRVRAVDRFVDQVVEIDYASLARRHPALWQVHERVEDRLRRPVDPHQLEGGLQSLERKLVVLPDDVDRDVTPAHLVQVVRDVPGRVEGGPVAPHEKVLRGVPFQAATGQVEVAGAVFLLAEGIRRSITRWTLPSRIASLSQKNESYVTFTRRRVSRMPPRTASPAFRMSFVSWTSPPSKRCVSRSISCFRVSSPSSLVFAF